MAGMYQILTVVEQTAFFTWVRESSSIWAYPSILFVHTVGLAIVVGLSTIVDVRLLGFARQLPFEPFERYFPFIWAGLWLNALSGSILFAADATVKLANPLFGVKMLLVALGTVSIVVIRRVVFGDRRKEPVVTTSAKVLAAASLVLWLGVTAAGRLMTYVR